jgi:hypothetical protein
VKGTAAVPPRASRVKRRALAPNKTPARRAYQASTLLLRRHDATDFLELVAHRPNVATRDLGRIGKPFATYHDLVFWSASPVINGNSCSLPVR